MSVEQISQWTSLQHMVIWQSGMQWKLAFQWLWLFAFSRVWEFHWHLSLYFVWQGHQNRNTWMTATSLSLRPHYSWEVFLVEWRSHSKWSPEYGRCHRAHSISNGQQCGHYSGILEMRPEALGADAVWEGVEADGQSFLLDMLFFIQSPGRIVFTELARSSHSLFTCIS